MNSRLIATMTAMWQESESKAFSLAKSQAQKSFDEGGLPIDPHSSTIAARSLEPATISVFS